MTRLVLFGLAIVLNATVLAAGLVWTKRQMKRVAAERSAEYRGLFSLEPLPPPGYKVQILVEEDDGKVSELDAVHWPHLGWTDARTYLKVDEDVLGWRRHPFREPPIPDYIRPGRTRSSPPGWRSASVATRAIRGRRRLIGGLPKTLRARTYRGTMATGEM